MINVEQVLCIAVGCRPAAVQTASYKVTAGWNAVFIEATSDQPVIYSKLLSHDVECNVNFRRFNCHQSTFVFLLCILLCIPQTKEV